MKVKRRRKNPLGVIIAVTAAFLICAVGVYFITAEGDFSLTGILDEIFVGSGEKRILTNSSETVVNVYALNNCYEFDIDLTAEEVVFDFFTLYYGAFGELRENELKQLYTYTSDSRVFDEFIHSYLTDLRKNSSANLTYPACDVEVTYESADTTFDGVTELTVNVSFSAAFDGFGGKISTMHNQRHFFRLKEKTKQWQIDVHFDLSGTGKYLNDIFNGLVEKDGLRREDISLSYMDGYLNNMREILKTELQDLYDSQENLLDGFENIESFEEPYDRESAVAYALEWSNRDRIIRNLFNYSSYENNSANFTSQCICAGGVPMDSLGKNIWKWYSNKYDESEQSGLDKTGYSLSWIDGKAFYSYAVNNTGFGLDALPMILTEAEKGDVIQFLKPDIYGGDVIYQCLVTGRSGKELAVTGNSDDVINVPVSVLGYDTARLIKIRGFNASNMNVNP